MLKEGKNYVKSKFAAFMDEAQKADSKGFFYKEVRIHFSGAVKEHVLTEIMARREQIYDSFIDNLTRRFSDLSRLRVFDVLNFNASHPIFKSEYSGEDSIDVDNQLIAAANLVNHALSHSNRGMNNVELLKEWTYLRSFVRRSGMRERDVIFTHIMQSQTIYPQLVILLEYFLTLPISSVECERSFSKMNNIKTERRNRLGEDTLCALMMISINGCKLDEFDPAESIRIWREELYKYRIFA
jgi:hypothetical protein